jgi:uncharacterized protein DUF6788
MSPRSHRPAPERHARSRLAQLVTQEPFLRGPLVERARPCGKPTCRCRHGQLHRSLYLATRYNGRRALWYIPRALEETVRQWVQNGRSLSQQLQDLHQLQLEQLLQRKQQLAEQRTKARTARPDRPR